MPLYHLVGAWTRSKNPTFAKRINDGLPETLAEWINFNGLTHLKIKLNGDDPKWDVERVLRVDRVTAADAEKAWREGLGLFAGLQREVPERRVSDELPAHA